MYLVMCLAKERSVEINFYGHIQRQQLPLVDDDGQIGMIPVFDTREHAEEYADGADILEIQLSELTERDNE